MQTRSSRSYGKPEIPYINNLMFQRICLAAAFSPRTEALLAEAARLTAGLGAHLTIVHVGQLEKEKVEFIGTTLRQHGMDSDRFKVIDEPGEPAAVILEACKKDKSDLLIAGALHREELVKYYIGTVGRTVLRKAPCSVLVITDPKIEREGFRNIGALADDTPFIKETLAAACSIGMLSTDARLHVLRDLKMFGLTLASADQISETVYDQLQEQLISDEISTAEQLLSGIPHDKLSVNIKVMAGKAGFEISKFANRKELDLLVVGMPQRKFHFLDRLLKHDLEYLFADLPCNLLLVKPVRS